MFEPLKRHFDTRLTNELGRLVENLQKYCDESQTRESFASQSYYHYKTLTTCFNLPIIVLSALKRQSSVFEQVVPQMWKSTSSLAPVPKHPDCVLSAVASYLKIGESMSKHESSANAWLLFHNELKHQLSLARPRRQDADEFLTTVKSQYDRLFELSPICSNSMIGIIKKKIAAHATNSFETPTYLNGFRHTEVYTIPEEEEYENNSISGDEV